jgi:hypothetical protein
MGPGTRRTGFNSSGLLRLLAELTSAEAAGSSQTFAERLGQWLGWTDAAALAEVLHAPVAAPTSSPAAGADAGAVQALSRLRLELAQAVASDPAFLPPRAKSNPVGGAAARVVVSDFTSFRHAYAAQQRQMAWRIAPLRQQLRGALAQRDAGLARLAALDAALEQALAERERSALAGVPNLLVQRYDRLRASQPAAADDAALAWQASGWLWRFGQDLQAVLRAEIELRLQPLQGLADSLNMHLSQPLATLAP